MRRQTSPNKSVCDCVSRCTVCTSNLTICAPQFRYVVALLLPYLIYANRRYKSSNDRRKLMHSFFPTKRGKSWSVFTCSSLCSNIGFLIDGVRYVCGLLWCCGVFFCSYILLSIMLGLRLSLSAVHHTTFANWRKGNCLDKQHKSSGSLVHIRGRNCSNSVRGTLPRTQYIHTLVL